MRHSDAGPSTGIGRVKQLIAINKKLIAINYILKLALNINSIILPIEHEVIHIVICIEYCDLLCSLLSLFYIERVT
jgi:hypothetical protein